MRTATALTAFLAVTFVIAIASAKEPPPPAAPVKPPEPTVLTLDTLLLKGVELPADVRLLEGVHPVSIQPNTFYEMPDMRGLLPAPVRKGAVSFVKEGGLSGTVYVLEYEGPPPEKLNGFLQGLLYGEGKRCDEHPEEIITGGNFLLLVSFPMADPGAEWYKARLRKEFHVPAPRTDTPAVLELGKKLYKAYEAQDLEAGKKLLAENGPMFEEWVLGNFLLAELAMKAKDGALAQERFTKAIDLHESFTDVFADTKLLWLCHDGVGIALLIQKKYADSVKALEHAKEVGRSLSLPPKELSTSDYSLACTYARWKKWDKALKALEAAIAADPKWKETAATDEDLAEAVKRKDFKALLAK